MSCSIFIICGQVIHCLPCYPLLFHVEDAQYPSPITCTHEVKSSITLQQKELRRTWSLCLRSSDWLSVLPTHPVFFFLNIFILLSQTGANGMCGQDFRIHHWLAEELAWAPCITCQSCQACCLVCFIIAPALCCLSPLRARFSPTTNYRPGGVGVYKGLTTPLSVSPGQQPLN